MSQDCQKCPEHADCLLFGYTVTPQPGYWHSTSFSTQIKKCIFEKACSHPDRTDILSNNAYLRAKSDSDIKYYSYHESDYNQCDEGYTNRLCGTCAENYAKTSSQCQKCINRLGTMFFILLQYILTIIVMVYFIMSVSDLVKRLEFNRKYNMSPILKEISLQKVQNEPVDKK